MEEVEANKLTRKDKYWQLGHWHMGFNITLNTQQWLNKILLLHN